jgi:hypothetical protein
MRAYPTSNSQNQTHNELFLDFKNNQSNVLLFYFNSEVLILNYCI